MTLQLRELPAQAALEMILKMQDLSIDYKFLEPGALVVAAPEKLYQIDGVPIVKVGFLQGQYPQVEFIPHPTKNGFYAVGLRHDLLAIKNDIPNLDRVQAVPPPPAKEFVLVSYGDLNEVKALLATLVPDVLISVDTRQGTLILEGAPEEIEQAKELMDQLDKPLHQVVLECKVVLMDKREEKRFGIDWTGTVLAQVLTTKSRVQPPHPGQPQLSDISERLRRGGLSPNRARKWAFRCDLCVG